MAHALLLDSRAAFRQLLRNRRSTLVAIATFACAILSNILVWQVALPLAVDPLPYPSAGRIVRVWQTKLDTPVERVGAAYGNVLLWRERARSCEVLGAYARAVRELLLDSGDGASFEPVRYAHVTPGFFETLAVPPALGRLFEESDWAKGSGVLIVSNSFWQHRLSADPKAVGRPIRQPDGTSSVVVGVMPPAFEYPINVDAWSAFYIPPSQIADQNSRVFSVVARLQPNETPRSLESELLRLQALAAREFPKTDVNWRPVVSPIREDLLGRVRSTLVYLEVIAGLLIVLSFASVSTLMIVRTSERRTQYAIQAALGASSARVRMPLVFESLIIALAGWAVAAVAAFWATALLVSWLPASLPRRGAIGLDGRALALALGVAIACGLLWGLFGARHLLRLSVAETLAGRSRRSTLHLSRRIAVVCAVAIAAVAVSAASVALGEVRRVQRSDPGFRNRHVVAAKVNISIPRLREISRSLPQRFPRSQLVFLKADPTVVDPRLTGATVANDLIERVQRIPGIELTAVAGTLPLADTGLTTTLSLTETLITQPPQVNARRDILSAQLIQATEAYFSVLDIPLVGGRLFRASDRLGAEPVAIVNVKLAQRLWPDGIAIGRTIMQEGERAPVRVVGVVANVATSRPGDPDVDQIYRPYAQLPASAIRLLVRTISNAEQVHRPLDAAAGELGAVVFDVQNVSNVVEKTMSPMRSATAALVLLALLAVAVASGAVYVLMSDISHGRKPELALRLAIGATRGNIAWLMLKTAGGLVAGGTIAGTLLAVLGARLLSNTVSIPHLDASTLLGGGVVLLAIGVLASLSPVVQATRVDSLRLLR